MKNYSDVWVKGSTNQRTSSILDHAGGSEQHTAEASRFRAAQRRSRKEPVVIYAPIARCLLTIDDPEKQSMKSKFDLSYFMAKEEIAFETFCSIMEKIQIY